MSLVWKGGSGGGCFADKRDTVEVGGERDGKRWVSGWFAGWMCMWMDGWVSW